MKIQKNILIAFILNLAFSFFEFFGGLITGSVAIISDSVHDMGDALSIGFSLFLEKKSRNQPDEKYTYGYLRYSVLGGFVTSAILFTGSAVVIYKAVMRILEPQDIDYNGMMIFAVVGVAVNLFAAFFTRDGESINQKAVSLHMLEDVLGWIVVLLGAVIMRLTDFKLIDPIMSVCVAIFIMINAYKNLKRVFELFVEKIPNDVSVSEVEKCLLQIDGISDVHHIHIRSIDGINSYATMHVVITGNAQVIKELIRQELKAYNICHVTIESECENEHCHQEFCRTNTNSCEENHHHHHHHHNNY